jgi:two-component system chemotaxis response regulator CheY
VDDSATVRQQVAAALQPVGFTIVEASDGREGLKAISANSGIKMVICDVNMPNMNGLEMVEAVKSKPEHKGLPIIMLTTEGQPALIKRAKEAGAMGWIVKPFKTDQLVATVQKLTA